MNLSGGEMALLGAFFFGFVPMFIFAAFVNWLDRYEKEPKLLLGAAFVWGVVIAGGGAYILNTVVGISIYSITGSAGAADFSTTSIAAPIIEEGLKGLAVLIVFLMFRKEFDSVLDGIVYGAITAMGFAAIENVIYIYRNGFQASGWEGFWTLVVIRVLLVSWMHPFFTAFTGIGLAVARLKSQYLRKDHCNTSRLYSRRNGTRLPQYIQHGDRRRRRFYPGLDRRLFRLRVHGGIYHLDDRQRTKHPQKATGGGSE